MMDLSLLQRTKKESKAVRISLSSCADLPLSPLCVFQSSVITHLCAVWWWLTQTLWVCGQETDPVPCDFVYNVCESRKFPPEDRVRDSTWSDRADWLLWVVVSMFTQHTKDPIWDCEETNSVSVPSLDKCEGRVRNDKIQILVEEEYGLVGCWTKELAYDTNTQPPTMQFWDPCPGTSTPAHISCQVTSVGYMIGLGEVSWWFHLKPLEVMTHTLFYKVMWRVTW